MKRVHDKSTQMKYRSELSITIDRMLRQERHPIVGAVASDYQETRIKERQRKRIIL
jgi:outer membrane protease